MPRGARSRLYLWLAAGQIVALDNDPWFLSTRVGIFESFSPGMRATSLSL